MKTVELSGALLALWVARASGQAAWLHNGVCRLGSEFGPSVRPRYQPHEDWAQGGPLLDKFDVTFVRCAGWPDGKSCIYADAGLDLNRYRECGPDRLTAMCRAIVGSVYGDIVPNEVAA